MQETNPSAAQQNATELALQHLASLTRTASALYSETGAMQRDMLRRSAALQREAARELARAVHPGEVLNVQAAYAVAGWQQMVDFSRELGERVCSAARLG